MNESDKRRLKKMADKFLRQLKLQQIMDDEGRSRYLDERTKKGNACISCGASLKEAEKPAANSKKRALCVACRKRNRRQKTD